MGSESKYNLNNNIVIKLLRSWNAAPVWARSPHAQELITELKF